MVKNSENLCDISLLCNKSILKYQIQFLNSPNLLEVSCVVLFFYYYYYQVRWSKTKANLCFLEIHWVPWTYIQSLVTLTYRYSVCWIVTCCSSRFFFSIKTVTEVSKNWEVIHMSCWCQLQYVAVGWAPAINHQKIFLWLLWCRGIIQMGPDFWTKRYNKTALFRNIVLNYLDSS
jgi:hypothetical protein